MWHFIKNNALGWVWIASLVICLFLTSVFVNAFNRSFYYEQFQRYQLHETIGTSLEEIKLSNDQLLDYLLFQKDEINVSVKIHGQQVEMFNEREKLHMVDVKQLVLTAGIVLIAFATLFVGLTFFHLKKGNISQMWLWFNQTLLGLSIVLCVIVGYALADFDSFWTIFHQLFFNNDLWLLNPATDRLIVMMPLELFQALVFRIVSVFLVILASIYIGVMNYGKKYSYRAL